MKVKMNLQYFAEEVQENDDLFFDESPSQEVEEDTIMPDDNQEQEQEEVTEVEEETKPSTEETEPVEQPLKIPIKYNKETRELTVEEAAELAQKGLNYEKAVERARQEARDAWIAEQGYEWNGRPIKTEADYKQALIEKELMEKYQDVPKEVVDELIENRKFREQFQAKEKEQQEQEKQQAHFKEFVESFPGVKPEDIPGEVWEKVNQGVPIKYAYMEHAYSQAQTKLKVYQQNETNAKKAPVGSVTAHGGQEIAPEDDFLRGFNS